MVKDLKSIQCGLGSHRPYLKKVCKIDKNKGAPAPSRGSFDYNPIYSYHLLGYIASRMGQVRCAFTMALRYRSRLVLLYTIAHGLEKEVCHMMSIQIEPYIGVAQVGGTSGLYTLSQAVVVAAIYLALIRFMDLNEKEPL